MKVFILLLTLLWALIWTAEPAFASCQTYQTLLPDGRIIQCTTCCTPGGGCSSTCS